MWNNGAEIAPSFASSMSTTVCQCPWTRKNSEKKSVFPLVLARTRITSPPPNRGLLTCQLARCVIKMFYITNDIETFRSFSELYFLFLCHFYGRECEDFSDHTIFRIIGNGDGVDKRVSRLKIAQVCARARQKTIAKAISRYLELIMRSSRKIYCGRQKLARCFFFIQYSLKKSRLTPAINSLLFFLIRKRFLYFALL